METDKVEMDLFTSRKVAQAAVSDWNSNSCEESIICTIIKLESIIETETFYTVHEI